jgi:hypothetical protein
MGGRFGVHHMLRTWQDTAEGCRIYPQILLAIAVFQVT